MFAWTWLVIADPHLEFPDSPQPTSSRPSQGSFRSLASLLQLQMSTAKNMRLYSVFILSLRSPI
jgi:hypothetical protein